MSTDLSNGANPYGTSDSLRLTSHMAGNVLSPRGFSDQVLRREAIERWENEGGDLLVDQSDEQRRA